MLFDTHAHMDDHAFDADRAQLLTALPGQGLALVMNPGCSLESSRNTDRLSREYDYIYAAVGSHPDVADEVNEAVLEEYRRIVAENPKIKAIGEIGLDYHYEDIPREVQKKAFRMQMDAFLLHRIRRSLDWKIDRRRKNLFGSRMSLARIKR